MGDLTLAPARRAGDLTAEWCTAALAAALGTARVVAVEATPVGTGQVADTVRLTLRYEPPRAGPATVIAKVPAADEASRTAARLTRTYEIEASFYGDLAPTLPVRVPRCYHAAHDPETDAYHVLLEDVAPAVQGDQMRGCTLEEITAAVDELVLLQGARWGDPALRTIRWLHRAVPESIDAMAALIGQCVPTFLDRYADRLTPATVALVERLAPRLSAYLHHRPGPWTVVHGDYRADNLLFGGPRVVVVDWQTVGLGPGPTDLAYLLGASVVPAVRRAHERAFVARYVEGLRGHGNDVATEDVWTAYRRSAFGGLIMAVVASTLVEQTVRGDEMFVTMAERHATHVADLDAEDLLPE